VAAARGDSAHIGYQGEQMLSARRCRLLGRMAEAAGGALR